MDSYVLADIIIKCIVILVGVYLIFRGRNAKNSSGSQRELLPPKTMIIIGALICVTNAYLIFKAIL